MPKRIKFWLLMLLWGAMIALNGCATVKNNAAVCRVRFDYADRGIEKLNLQNVRALASFKALCP